MLSADPGSRAVRFFNNLTHTGDYTGEPFALRPWQEGPIRKLFGTLRKDGARQYRKTFWALPRKQGKTEIVAAGSLYLLMGQGRSNQRIYTASGDTEQAALIFRAACDMLRNDPELEANTLIYEGYKKIEFPAGNSILKVLSSVPKSKHGLGPTAVLIDEYHVVDEDLVNVLTTGFGARKDPLTWMITTAGWDRQSVCFDEWQHAVRVRDGVVKDPTYLPVIHAAEPSDDWKSEAVWRKAMPALGDFCSLEFIREEFKKACDRPRFENTFKQLYLNLWTEQAQRWISTAVWDGCKREIDWTEYESRECFAGLDLSSTVDLTALVLAFPNERGGLDLLPFFWLPGESALKRERTDNVPYTLWDREGHLEKTDGEAIDYDVIGEKLASLAQRFDIRCVAFDPAFSRHFAQKLYDEGRGIPLVELPNTPYRLNEPSREFERQIIEGQIGHAGNPVMDWCISNVAIVDRNGLIMPSKLKSTGRIDGVAAAVMAVRAWQGQPDETSPYNERGLTVL